MNLLTGFGVPQGVVSSPVLFIVFGIWIQGESKLHKYNQYIGRFSSNSNKSKIDFFLMVFLMYSSSFKAFI